FALRIAVALLHGRGFLCVLSHLVLIEVPRDCRVALPHVMEDLAHAGREIATLPKQLRQEHDVRYPGTQECLKLEDAGGFRTQATEERPSAWCAKSVLAVGPIKAHASGCQSIDVRRFDQGVTVTAEVGVQIIYDDEKHIELATCLTGVS